ncbi:hypothetical protein [Sinorhizobium meliloti]|uniref:hypothetical protein n=1 Tax=Rhizobium meliloti TaxID=382 RepID=UPI0012FE0343|nr:hypothetical protein [Sinorhizobium meliloti]
MSDVGTYKTPNEHGVYEDFDTWRERKAAEAAAHQRERGLEARLTALERRVNARYSEVVEAMTLAFGDLREEMRETHETLVGRQVQRATKDASRAFANEIQKLRNEVTFLERRVKELESKRGTK